MELTKEEKAAQAQRRRRITRDKNKRAEALAKEAKESIMRSKARKADEAIREKNSEELQTTYGSRYNTQVNGRGQYDRLTVLDMQSRWVQRTAGQLQREFAAVARARNITIPGRTSYRATDRIATVNVTANPYSYEPKDKVELGAYTDFERIVLTINPHAAPNYKGDKNLRAAWMRRMRAALVHEMGHMEFTIPLKSLTKASGYTNGDVAAFNIKGADIDPNSHGFPLEHSYHPWLQSAWNVLEDQRMETAVVKNYPHTVDMLTNLIVSFIVLDTEGHLVNTSWMLVGSRSYLPSKVRSLAAEAFNKHFEAEMTQEVKDLLLTDPNLSPAGHWYKIVEAYKAATDTQTMMEAVLKAAEWTTNMGADMSDASHTQNRYGTEAQPDEMQKRLKEGASKSKPQPTEKQDGKGKAGAGEADKADEESDHDSGSTAGDGGEGETPEDFDPLAPPTQSDDGNGSSTFNKQQLEDLFEQIVEDEAEKGESALEASDMKEFFSSDNTGLPEYHGTVQQLPEEFVSKANSITTGIEQALQTFVTANEPVWRSGMDEGVLEAVRYRCKDIGDTDYRRNQDHSGREGIDIHVSILADVSGSMASNMGALSGAIYAMSQAAANVGVGVDTVLWSSEGENYRVTADDAQEALLYPAMGGTSPDQALQDLVNSPIEGHVNHHLVIIFTDGAWGGGWHGSQGNSLDDFREDANFQGQRHFVVAKYGVNGRVCNGADAMVELQDIMQLPDLMESGLIDLLEGE